MAKKKNTSESAYDADMFLLDFVGGCVADNTYVSQVEYTEAILEIESMIQYSIYRGDEEEVKFWRAMLQRTRVEKRRAKMKNLHRRVAIT